MSTKTTFKRIALVAVAALGLGVLSVAPSSAAVTGLTVTATAGTAGVNGAKSDTTTASIITVSAQFDAGTADTLTVQFLQAAAYPTGASVVPVLQYLDTTTASTVGTPTLVNTDAGTTTWTAAFKASDSATAGNPYKITPAASGTTAIRFALYLDSISSTAREAGTYSYNVITKTYVSGALTATTSTPATITITAPASASKTASVAYSTLGDPSVAAAVATVSTTAAAKATLALQLKNASNNAAARESVTATITGPGTIGDGTVIGKSVVLKYNSDSGLTINVYSDGTAGTSTINVSTPSVTFAPKTITFYSKSPKTITASVNNPVLNVGANTKAVKATAVDSNGNAWTGQLYIVASAAADALVGGSATAPVECSYDSDKLAHYCPITTLIAGTANFKVIDQTLDTDATYTTADSAATSNEVSVTASAGVPTTVKLAFDKATYAPFEKAIITVTPLDAAGKTLGSRAITNLFATGGISANQAFGSSSDTLTAVSLTTSADSSSTAPRTAGAYTYTVYMPAQGTVTISATGGVGLAAAGQVAVSASAEIVNSSVDAATDAANEATDAANAATDAALAAADAADAATAAAQDASDAVAALSATVAKLVASLKAQITSLTNLVIKIQKKVKA